MKVQILRLNWVCLFMALLPSVGLARSARYTLVLADPPMTQFEAAAGKNTTRAALTDHRARIAAAQQALMGELKSRRIRANGSVSGLLNAVFVTAEEGSQAELGLVGRA